LEKKIGLTGSADILLAAAASRSKKSATAVKGGGLGVYCTVLSLAEQVTTLLSFEHVMIMKF